MLPKSFLSEAVSYKLEHYMLTTTKLFTQFKRINLVKLSLNITFL